MARKDARNAGNSGQIPPQQQPRKKSHKVRNTVIGVAGVVVIGTIIGSLSGGGDSGDNNAGAAGTTTATTAQHDKAPTHKAKQAAKPAAPAKKATRKPAAPAKSAVDTHDPKNEFFVMPGTCKADPVTHWPSAKVKIVNPTSDPSNFTATVVFESTDGKTQYDTGLVVANNLGHGQTTTVDAQGLNEVPAGATMRCRITQQDRYAS